MTEITQHLINCKLLYGWSGNSVTQKMLRKVKGGRGRRKATHLHSTTVNLSGSSDEKTTDQLIKAVMSLPSDLKTLASEISTTPGSLCRRGVAARLTLPLRCLRGKSTKDLSWTFG